MFTVSIRCSDLSSGAYIKTKVPFRRDLDFAFRYNGNYHSIHIFYRHTATPLLQPQGPVSCGSRLPNNLFYFAITASRFAKSRRPSLARGLMFALDCDWKIAGLFASSAFSSRFLHRVEVSWGPFCWESTAWMCRIVYYLGIKIQTSKPRSKISRKSAIERLLY